MYQENYTAELPLGFSMAMARNPEALNGFSNMSESEKHKIINKCHNVKSKKEMQQLVDSIAKHEFF